MAENIKEKIKKLLALATSPNENEARAALLKAKEIMAKHKISQDDVEGMKEKKLVHQTCNSVKWTTDSGNIWMVDIAKIICDNYCCVASWATVKGTRTHTLCISGMEDDVEICKPVIEYAIGFVLGKSKIISRKHMDAKAAIKSYSDGFVIGLEMAFEDQKDEHPEWGLVVVKPQEVQDYENNLGNKNVRTKKTGFDPLAYMKGQNDGMNFNNVKAIEKGA